MKMVKENNRIMAENKIGLKSIEHLISMNFYIPRYQRGYRWTRQQVWELLNDIWEFSQKKGPTEECYCIQPLVVRKRENDIFKKIKEEAKTLEEVENLLKGSWDVIDGQQRLTTIFIILSVLGRTKQYSLEYETRPNSKCFLENIEPSRKEENIDFFHIVQAKSVVDEFFRNTEIDTNVFLKTLLSDVKFIWYEIVDEDPIRVFTRLNIGRIPLTNAELIKALILNSSNFGTDNTNYIRLLQQEIALEWDNIEYSLQNDEFWLFLNHPDYNKPTRIDFIFDMIVEMNKLGFSDDEMLAIGQDEYRTFRYFFTYFSKNKNENGIKTCWSEVKKYFQTFEEWFNDLEMYHYAGYLVEQREQKVRLSDIYEKWGGNKDEFIDELKTLIKKTIKNWSDLNQQYELNGIPKTKCKPLLLLHNIQTVISQNNRIKNEDKYSLPVFYKFPFHLYKKENWDVEHIDSNTTNALDKEKDQKEWLKCSLLDNTVYNSEIKDLILNFVSEKDDKITFNELVEKIDKLQGNKEKRLSDEEKNKVWNFVLLDAGTNRGYGNAIFPAKRRTIIGKDQGKDIIVKDDLSVSEEVGAIAFVPPVTKNVFMKYYNATVDDLRAWTRVDAEVYKNNIYSMLKEFGVVLNSNNND